MPSCAQPTPLHCCGSAQLCITFLVLSLSAAEASEWSPGAVRTLGINMALCRPPALRGEGLPLTQGRPGWARDTRSLRAWTWSSSRLRLLGSPLLPGVSDAGLLVPAGAQGAPLGAVRVLPGGFRRQDASRQPFKLHCVVRTFLLLLSRSVVSDSATSRLACSRPALPVLPELAQTHVHRVGDAIQPSHPLSSPSPPAFSLSQHQGLSQ